MSDRASYDRIADTSIIVWSAEMSNSSLPSLRQRGSVPPRNTVVTADLSETLIELPVTAWP
jgi:hypothetical protein